MLNLHLEEYAMKSKSITTALSIAVIIIFISLISFALSQFFTADDLQYRIFNDINDILTLDTYVTKELSTESDKYLKNIIPVEHYTNKLLYENNTYTVYAYVFNSTDDAITYFKNCTGKNTDSNQNYSMSTNILFSSSYIVLYNNCAYRIEGGNYKSFAKAVNFFCEAFETEKIN